jgi:hypothetical protein
VRNATNIGRLSMLAAGLGIGAALAWTPGVALADPSTMLTPTEIADIDKVLVALFDPSGAPIQVSINGMELFPTDGNTAMATSGTGDIAIAVGDGANAVSAGPAFPFGIPLGSGFGDVAFANGTNSTADAGLIGSANFDFVYANGANSFANAGLGANFDIASAAGTGSKATVALGDSFDLASANGTNSSADVGLGNSDLAFANGTDSTATTGVGNNDVSMAFTGGNANAGGFSSTALASDGGSATSAGGFFDSAYGSGTNVSALANGDSAIASAIGTNAEANAVGGFGDLASVFNTGSAFDQAIAGGTIGGPIGSHDLAWIFGTGSTAIAGSDLTTAGNFDNAIVFGDMLNAVATGKDFLIELLPWLSLF